MMTPIGRAIPAETAHCPAVHALQADAPPPTRTIGELRFPSVPRPGAFSALSLG
jgi:hypothetical protein